MKKKFILYTLLIFSNIAMAQNFSLPIQACIDKIISNGEIKFHIPAQVDSSILELSKITKFEDLETMSTHDNSLIRVAALICLLEKDNQHENLKYFSKNGINEKTGRTLMSFFKQHLYDTATVNWRFVEDEKICKFSVIEIYLNKIGGYWKDDDYMILLRSENYLSKKEMRWIDSIMVATDFLPKDIRKNRILQLEALREWYEIVKNKAKTDLLQEDIVYLAKYQKEEDVDFIIANIPPLKEPKEMFERDRTLAFQHFQHPKMLDYLQKEAQNAQNISNHIYLIAMYKNEIARDLLCQFHDKDKKYASEIIGSIDYFYTPLYQHLAWKILKENVDDNSVRVPKQLWKTVYADSLVDFYFQRKQSSDKWARRSATDLFLDLDEYLVEKNDSRRAKIVMDEIELGGDYSYNYYDSFEKIWKSNDCIFTKPLFELLAKEPLGENRFYLCKILLHQPEKDIENQLIKFFEKKPTLFPVIKDAEKGGSAFSDFIYKMKYRDENKK